MSGHTHVSIVGDAFLINGQPTYAGRNWRGRKIEGLLLNSRMVQGIFDDLNPKTTSMWAYPDTGTWDAERNTRDFIAAMPAWRNHGLLSFDICLQGGSPRGYTKGLQPWHNNPFEADGSFGPTGEAYLARLRRILGRADELGMVAMLCVFYFGQDERLAGDAAVLRALDGTVDWILGQGYTNVLVEVANEIDNDKYEQPLLKPGRAAELNQRVRDRSGGRLLTSVSLCGGVQPSSDLVASSDYVLLHGNGVSDPARIRQMVDAVRSSPGYRDKPILFNEDDHFGFDQPDNNFLAALDRYAGWGYFDYRMAGEGFADGYQSVPVDWGINSPRKKAFFGLLAEVTGAV